MKGELSKNAKGMDAESTERYFKGLMEDIWKKGPYLPITATEVTAEEEARKHGQYRWKGSDYGASGPSGIVTTPETKITNNLTLSLEKAFGDDIFFFKVRGDSMQARGIPDVIGCLGGRMLGIEVKTEDAPTITDTQTHRLTQINRAGGIGMVVVGNKGIKEAIEYLTEVHDTWKRRSNISTSQDPSD